MIKKMDRIVTPGSKWHIVSNKWFDLWQKYTYCDLIDPNSKQSGIKEDERVYPEKINNKDIILKLPNLLEDASNGNTWKNI